ncbi:PspC domain-containing protein [Gleimia sp. 6138-11-ORH1]|uniref:ATP-binding protein n=1 Tax=Gleimia sp. 6138-11-ORH1 TaxID=2973937 RepID=UPI0021690605|nr:ATP-binding protein [Gleimia sp. 6138-11-ORH1]MCS4485182.1 PspC domain-containing protein [Gleimia sp. 6138-11-ORH1]
MAETLQPNNQRLPLERTRPGDPYRPTPYVAGVASGLALHLDIKVAYIRWFFVLINLFAFFGAGIILYVWLWATVKPTTDYREYNEERLAQKQKIVNTGWQIPSYIQGIMLATPFLLVSIVGLMHLNGWYLLSDWHLGIALLSSGILIIWTQTQNLNRWIKPAVATPLTLGFLLQIGGILLISAAVQIDEPWVNNLFVGIAILASVTLSLAPFLMYSNQEYQNAKLERVRETERADIAAHLHDSVLQTLMLIKANAMDAAKVKSLAIQQERELRAWLYTGVKDTQKSFSEQLRQTISEIETSYGTEVEAVCVGDTTPGPNELTIIAATAEATKNAVRHGKPPVRVFSEIRPGQIDIYIRDHGCGFTLENIAPDRHGVKDSIIGRMERAGGTAKIRKLELGTEIHLTIPPSEKEGK